MARMVVAFVIVISVAGVFDRAGVRLAVDRYLQASAGFVFMAQSVAKGSIDDFKSRSGALGISRPSNRFQGVFYELPALEQLQSDLRQRDGNGLFCGSVEQMDRHRVGPFVMEQLGVVLLVSQLDQMPAVRALGGVRMSRLFAVIVAVAFKMARLFGAVVVTIAFVVAGWRGRRLGFWGLRTAATGQGNQRGDGQNGTGEMEESTNHRFPF